MRVLLAVCLLALSSVASAASFDAVISWTDNSANEDGFRVYQDGAQIVSLGAGVTTFTVTGLAENARYCWQVGAFNSVGEARGGEACGTTGVVPVPPAAPGTPTILYIGRP